jgi:predicted DNA-binding transcriptional regulator YafY
VRRAGARPALGARRDTAAAQLRRLLDLVPRIADGEPYPVRELARLAHADSATLLRDLRALVGHYDAPGGFVEGLSVMLEPDTVEVRTPHFRRPMALVPAELRALELGLTMLAAERPPEERGPIDRARRRLRAALAALPRRAPPRPSARRPTTRRSPPTPPRRSRTRRATRWPRCARRAWPPQGAPPLPPRRRGRGHRAHRVALRAGGGARRLVRGGVVRREHRVRIFRLDRIEAAGPTDERYEIPADFDVADVVRDGRAFVAATPPRALVVRYAPAVARWIAERERGTWEPDGALVRRAPAGRRGVGGAPRAAVRPRGRGARPARRARRRGGAPRRAARRAAPKHARRMTTPRAPRACTAASSAARWATRSAGPWSSSAGRRSAPATAPVASPASTSGRPAVAAPSPTTRR